MSRHDDRPWLAAYPEGQPTDSVLGIAPLFHVTGLSGHIAPALRSGALSVGLPTYTPGWVQGVASRR